MINHYHKARGKYKQEISDYVFYDLCGNTTRLPIEELELKQKNNRIKNEE